MSPTAQTWTGCAPTELARSVSWMTAQVVFTSRETYLRDGRFDPQSMIDFWRNADDRARLDGYDGVRVVGEMSWALEADVGSRRLTEYEVLLNNFLPRPVSGRSASTAVNASSQALCVTSCAPTRWRYSASDCTTIPTSSRRDWCSRVRWSIGNCWNG
jgi:hypothetical protein